MKFWRLIFDAALGDFKTENKFPEGRAEIYDIRNTANWDAVYARLQLAREAYDSTKKGFWGRSKKMRRSIADHAGPIRGLTKFIPDGTYTSPVRAAVEVLIDVRPSLPISALIPSSVAQTDQ